jgi:hypothetical protein
LRPSPVKFVAIQQDVGDAEPAKLGGDLPAKRALAHLGGAGEQQELNRPGGHPTIAWR